MQRTLVFIYGILSYFVFFATFVYAIGFIGNFMVPKGIDSAPQIPFLQALLINLGLLAVFAIHHSLMARKSLKRWLTRFIPQAAERSTYVLVSSLLLIATFVFWQPMGGVIWDVQHTTGSAAIYSAYAFGWLLVLYATFLINHFDLFGLRQVWNHMQQRPTAQLPFVMPFAYRLIRHPLYLGWMFVFWATPTMTVAHLVFALACTGYIFVGIWFEERDLVEAHPEYQSYRSSVPMIIPFMGRKKANLATQSA